MTTTSSTDTTTTTTTAATADTKSRSRSRRITSVVAPVVVLFLVIGLWYLITYALLDPTRRFLMPPPHQVIADGLFGESVQTMLQALGRTATVALTGLAIAAIIGIVWAVIMSQSHMMENALFPYAVVLQCIPILALVPLVGFSRSLSMRISVDLPAPLAPTSAMRLRAQW